MKNTSKQFTIFFLYFFFLKIFVSYGQIGDTTIHFLFHKAINTIDLKEIEFNYSDSADLVAFDFENFLPSVNKEKGIKYKAFYNQGEMVKLVRYEKSNPETYEFYFWDFEKYKIYIVSTIYEGNTLDLLSNINGFFIYDKTQKLNFFFGVENSWDEPVFDEKSGKYRQLYLIDDTIPDTKSIRTIILLNKKLEPTDRLNFYNNIFISSSIIGYFYETYFEKIDIYSEMEEAINLSFLTFNELYILFIKPPENDIALKIGIILNHEKTRTIWADRNWGYIYSPSQNLGNVKQILEK